MLNTNFVIIFTLFNSRIFLIKVPTKITKAKAKDYAYQYIMDGAKVTFGNIESLITNKWLNDSTIEFYYNSLKMNSVYILSCREAHSFFVDGNILNFADKITNYTYLLAPICLNNNHWTCILIDLTKYLFYYFDPLGLVNELALVDLYFDLWQKYYANVFEKKNWKKCPILHPNKASE